MTKPVKKPSRGKPATKSSFKKKMGKPTRARSSETRSDSAEERNYPRRRGKPGGKSSGKPSGKFSPKGSARDSYPDSGPRRDARKYEPRDGRKHEAKGGRQYDTRGDRSSDTRDSRSYTPRDQRAAAPRSDRKYEPRQERREPRRDERQGEYRAERAPARNAPAHKAPSRFERRKGERQLEARGSRQDFKRDDKSQDSRRPDRRDERRNERHDQGSGRSYAPREERRSPPRAREENRPFTRERDDRRSAAPREDKRKLGRSRYASAEQRNEMRAPARPLRKPAVKVRPAAKPEAVAAAVPAPAPVRKEAGPERIAKRLAHAGIASRRDIERMVAEGRITVNGTVITSPALNVTADDVILVDGNVVGDKPGIRLFRYHKPTGLVTTAKDPQGRPTVFEKMPKEMGRVVSVGRLDLNSEGLLLLTNNGELARHLELPTTGWKRVYRVRVHGTVSPDKLAQLAEGIEVDGVKYGAIEAELDAAQDRANVWLTVTLREGKNREIRRVMEAIGLTVNRLLRVSYGPFSLGELPRGAIMEVPKKVLRDQFGKLFEI